MREPTACPAARRQRGAAALVVTSMLFFAMVLTAMFVNRNLLVEQLGAANHDRAAKAFEAAEAGLEWALAQLNNPQRLGADCTLSAATSASAFRAHYLRADARSGRFTPAEWSDAGVISNVTCRHNPSAGSGKAVFDPHHVPVARPWIAIRIDRKPDWATVAELVAEAYRMVAAPHLVARLDAQPGAGKRGWRAGWIGRDDASDG